MTPVVDLVDVASGFVIAFIILCLHRWWFRPNARDFYAVEMRTLDDAGAEDKGLNQWDTLSWQVLTTIPKDEYQVQQVARRTDGELVVRVFSKTDSRFLVTHSYTIFDDLRAAEIYFDELNRGSLGGYMFPGVCIYLGVLTASSRAHAVRKLGAGIEYLPLRRTRRDVLVDQRQARAEVLRTADEEQMRGERERRKELHQAAEARKARYAAEDAEEVRREQKSDSDVQE